MDTGKVIVEKLSDNNYLIWSAQMEALLEARGVWRHISGETNLEGPQAGFTHGKNVARALIICSLTAQYVAVVVSEKDPKNMWDKLKEVHTSRCMASEHSLRHKLLTMKKKETENVRAYASKICSIEYELSCAGHKLEERDKKFALLNGLGSEFNIKKQILQENYADTFDRMVSSLEMFEADLGEREKDQGSTFAMPNGRERRTKGKCYICTKPGHIMSKCFYNPKSNSFKSHLKPSETILKNLKRRKLVKDAGGGSSQPQGDECEFAFMTLNESGIHNRWFLDSCCSRHLTNSRDGLLRYKALSEPEDVRAAAEGAAVSVLGIGDLRVSQNINGKEVVSLLKNVGYAPECRTNLISLVKAQQAGVCINFEGGKTSMTATHKGKILMKGDSRKFGIVEISNLQPVVKGVHEIAFFNAGKDDSMELAHRRTCHTAVSTLQEMERKEAVLGLDYLKSIDNLKNKCTSCVDGKATKASHLPREKKAREILDLMHMDLVVDIKPKGLKGEQHCQLLTDDYSGAMWASTMKLKSGASSATKTMVLQAQKMSGKKVNTIRTDGAKELIEGDTKKFLDENSTLIEESPPYSPESNGRAERANRTVFEKVRTILADLHMMCSLESYKKLWPEAIQCVVYVYNRTLTKSTHKEARGKTPYELVTGNKPDISNLRIFGSQVKVIKPKKYKGSKVGAKVWTGIHVGYAPGDAYRSYIPEIGRVFVSKDVTFIEKLYRRQYTETVPSIPGHVNEEESSSSSESDYSDEDDGPDVISKKGTKTRSGRKSSPPERYGDYAHLSFLTTEAVFGSFSGSSEDAPTSAEDALCSKRSAEWNQSMMEELNSLAENDVFDVVDKPIYRKVISNRWVFALKRNIHGKVVRCKSRLVGKGFSQVEGIDYQEVFSPVVRYETLRFLLAHCTVNNLELQQVDVKTAFLHGELDEEIYMELPDVPEKLLRDVESKGDARLKDLCNALKNRTASKVLKLKKAIYGLKQASKQWNKKLKSVLEACGCIQSTGDPCLFYMIGEDGDRIYVLIYVDDMLIAAKTLKDSDSVIAALKEDFTLSNAGPAHLFLGIRIRRDRRLGYMDLSQVAYIKKVLSRFNLADKAKKVPMDANLKLEKATTAEVEAAKHLPYRQLIGCLMYLAITSRPDIMFPVSRLARYNSAYGTKHYDAAKDIARYIYGTMKMVLRYQRDMKDIVGYTDADYAGDVDGRKSTSGFVFKYGGAAFSWSSKRQTIVALSSAESEYIAQFRCIREALWVRKLRVDFGLGVSAIDICADNQGAISLSQDYKLNASSKHIDTKYHMQRDYQDQGYVAIKYIPSDEMVADGMTKPLQKIKLHANNVKYGLVVHDTHRAEKA